MNNKELQALRKLLMLETAEAAEHVGEVRARTWYYWEEGRNPIPPEVSERMLELVEARGLRIKTMLNEGLCSRLPYHTRIEDYLASPATPDFNPDQLVISWRISQSVAAHFLAEGLADLT